MSQLTERIASAGWPMLMEMDGEPVSYARYAGTSLAAGFPKSIDVAFRVDNQARKSYEDGRGDLSIGVVEVKVSDVGSVPVIGTDQITRADASVWVVEEVREVVAGVAIVEVARYAHVSKSSRTARIER